jgi:hypothetical protein
LALTPVFYSAFIQGFARIIIRLASIPWGGSGKPPFRRISQLATIAASALNWLLVEFSRTFFMRDFT